MSRAAETRSRPGLLSWQTVVPVAAALVVVALALPAALEGVRDLLGPALRQEGIDIGWLDRDWSAWWRQWRWVGLVAAALLVVVMVWSWWRTRRARRRAEQLEILTSRLAKVMPPDWDAGQLRVRRWHGVSPVRVQLRLSAQCLDSDPEWRLAITMTLRSRMGPIAPIAWPRPGDRRRRIDVRVRPPATGGDVPKDGGGGQLDLPEVEERLVKALAGLVPRPVPKARRDRDGKLVVEVGYGETTRDQSLQWRSRVAEQASARLDLKFRAVWDRHRRVFSLLPVPELPETIDWVGQARQLRKLNVGRYVAGYGTDENGATVAWEPGDGQPHAMMNGPTGSGKTVAMKSLLNSLLLSGCLVAILDIKKIDYAAYLGRPGVVCVATTTEDIVGALMDLMAEVHRRNAAGQLRRLTEQYPHLGGDIPPPAQAAIDQVPLIIFFDELAVFVDELDSWWRSLSKAERLEKWGSDASTPPAKQIPSQIVSIARAISIHLCVGTQRGDARNFGDSTNMRDNIKHMVSMGAQSAIGSEMQWGDRSIGRDVEITDDVGGIGVSNGLRISSAGDRLGRDVPGRYKAWFSDKVEQTENFWAEVAEVAADATLVNLPHVSTAARDPHAAARDLWVHAYGDPGGTWPLLPTADTPEETDDELVGPDEPGTSGSDADGISNQGDADGISDTDEASAGGISVDPDLRRAADLVVETGSGSAALLQRRLRIGSARAQRLITELEGLGVVGPAHARTKPREVLVTADELPGILDSKAGGDLPAPVTGDRDSTGRVWEQVPVVRVEIGDLVVIGDLDEAEVLEGPSDVVDDLTGGELLRLVVLADAEEQVVDLDYDEVVARARP